MSIAILATAQSFTGTALASLAGFQADSINSGNSKLLMVFIGLVALAMVTIAVVVVALAVFATKAEKRLMAQIEEIKAKTLPLIDKSHVLIQDLSPQIVNITAKVHQITSHVEEIAGIAKSKAHEFSPTVSAANDTFRQANETAREANFKTRVQVDRVNGMISSALDATAQFGKAIQHGVTQPGREVSGVVAGVKAALGTFLGRASTPSSFSSTGRGGYRSQSRPPVDAYRSAVDAYRAAPAPAPREEEPFPGQRRN